MTKFSISYVIWHLELSSILLQPRFLDICWSVYFTTVGQNQLTVHQIWTMWCFFFSIKLSSSIAPMFILRANKHLLNANKVAHIVCWPCKTNKPESCHEGDNYPMMRYSWMHLLFTAIIPMIWTHDRMKTEERKTLFSWRERKCWGKLFGLVTTWLSIEW